MGNRYGPITIIAPVSSKIEKHIQIYKRNGINKKLIVMREQQIWIIDKARLIEKIDVLTKNTYAEQINAY